MRLHLRLSVSPKRSLLPRAALSLGTNTILHPRITDAPRTILVDPSSEIGPVQMNANSKPLLVRSIERLQAKPPVF